MLHIFILASAYLLITWHIPSLILFSIISTISISVVNFNSTPVFFNHSCHTNSSTEKMYVGLSLYISRHLLRKVSNTSANRFAHAHLNYLF